jgi:DNA-binding NarL/FixJ family response regulator
MIRVLVVDDHGIVREGLQRLLDAFEDIAVAGLAGNGEEAVGLVSSLAPDVVLMDLEMPGEMDGVAATRAILVDNPQTKVLILTSFSDRDRILRAVDAGAIGYVLKDGPAEDLVRALRAAARGEFPIDPKAARVLLEGRVERSPTEGISARGVEVLGLVGAGLPNREIARRLEITERTVKGHLTSIFRQIGVTDRTQAALWAHRNGIGGPDSRSS